MNMGPGCYTATFKFLTNDGFGGVVEELAEIQGMKVQFDVDMAWNEGIRKVSEITVDPEQFVLRMAHKNGSLSKAYDPDSKIVDLLSNFNDEMEEYPVIIMPKVDVSTSTPLQPFRQGSESAPMVFTWGDRDSPEQTPTNSEAGQGQYTSKGKNDGGQKRALDNDTFMMPPPLLPPPCKRIQRVFEDDELSIMTMASMASQDSRADLADIGIPYEDIKTIFLERIKRLNNYQLLRARQALRVLKARDYRRDGRQGSWTRWSLRSPCAVTLIRSLFDV